MNAISNDRAVKRKEKCSETEQPLRKNRRKLTEDQEEEADAERKVRSLIESLEISLKELDKVLVVDYYNIDDFLEKDFCEVLGKLPDGEKIRLFQYLLQGVDPTIAINQLQYNIKEEGDREEDESWIQSSFNGSYIYFSKKILDKEEMLESLYSIADVKRLETLPAYFIFPYSQEDDLNDIKDRVMMPGIDYKKHLENLHKQAYEIYKVCRAYMINEENITNGRNVTNISKETAGKIQAYVDNVTKIKDEVNQAYAACINEIIEIYSNEMIDTGNMMDMKLLPNKSNRFYDTCITKLVNTLSSGGLSNITKVKTMVNILWRRVQTYLEDMWRLTDKVDEMSEKDVEKSPDFGILSVALMGNSWKYQKIALIPDDIQDFELAYTTMEELFEELSLEFNATAIKSKKLRQSGTNDRDDYLLDLINILNCELYSCSDLPGVAELEISSFPHSFPYILAKQLRKIHKKRLKEIHQMRLEEERQRMIEADSKSN